MPFRSITKLPSELFRANFQLQWSQLSVCPSVVRLRSAQVHCMQNCFKHQNISLKSYETLALSRKPFTFSLHESIIAINKIIRLTSTSMLTWRNQMESTQDQG